MKNIHINMNEFTNASRVLKQVNSLVKNNIFDEIKIMALGSESLPEFERISDKVTLHRINLRTRKLPKNIIFQSIKYLEFSAKALKMIAKTNPDVINSHSVATLPICYITKKIFSSQLVYDTHELETETHHLSGLKKKLSKILEKNIIKHVDLIFVVSESISDWYNIQYKLHKPTVVLNSPEYQQTINKNILRDKFKIRNDQLILLYQGGLTEGRGVPLLLEVARNRDDDKIIFVFMGYGPLEEKVKSIAQKAENIYFLPAVSPSVLLDYTSSADFGIHLIQNTCLNHYYCMPNKLFEYTMAGLPVIVSNMKDMSEFVLKYKIGKIVKNLSISSINNAIDEMLNEDLSQLKKNSNQAAIENSWNVQEQKMISAYETMLNIRRKH